MDVLNGKGSSDIQHEQSERENELINKQKALQELITATKTLEEGNTRLAAAMNNRKFIGIDIAEVFVSDGNAKLTVFKKLID